MLAKDWPQIGRVPPELKEILKELARKNDRSLNQELINRVKRTLKEDGIINA